MFILHPYLRTSRSVKALLEGFEKAGENAKIRVKTAPRNRNSIVIHWGVRPRNYDTSLFPQVNGGDLSTMSNKLRFFQHVGENCDLTPEWTTSEDCARGWEQPVVGRAALAASGGAGIHIWDPESDPDDGFPSGLPLYTRYQRKTAEYRCHVFRHPYRGQNQPGAGHGRLAMGDRGREEVSFTVRLVQQKVAKKDDNGVLLVKDWKVRNLENGFFFQKNNLVVPDQVISTAETFMTKYFPYMDFCALDLIYHKPSQTCLVLEGNTAPGLEGTTVDTYIQYFQEVKNA